MTTAASLPEDIRPLVNLALAGDQHAMVRIVERYWRRVFGLCYRMLGQREDAEDVSQEAFLRVLRNLGRWDQGREFEPWLLTIAANRCRTQLARRKTRREDVPLTLPPPDASWHAETAATQLLEEVRLAMTDLPDNHQRAFLLFHQQQKSYAEISRTLRVPEGTAKTWVRRARRQLAERLIARDVVQERHDAV